jgi:hypothetical protein
MVIVKMIMTKCGEEPNYGKNPFDSFWLIGLSKNCLCQHCNCGKFMLFFVPPIQGSFAICIKEITPKAIGSLDTICFRVLGFISML